MICKCGHIKGAHEFVKDPIGRWVQRCPGLFVACRCVEYRPVMKK